MDIHQHRLQQIIGRARKYGVDVYLVLAYHPLPDSFFASHPDTRGTPFKAYGGTNVLCTSGQPVRRYIEEATANIFRRAPDLRGLVFIVRGEGFIHCYTRNMNCPRCSQRSAQDVIAEFASSGPMGPVQKGPAHSLFLNPDYKPLHNTGRQFKNNLSWTEPWGVAVVIREFEQLVEGWQKGVDTWEQVIAASPPAYKAAARREGGVGRALLACFRSILNVARFYQLRDEIKEEKSAARALKLRDHVEKTSREELENARAALPVILADSRLGYANSAGASSTGVPRGGIYSPGSIEKKIRQVENLLKKEIPEFQTQLKTGRS